MRLPTRHRGVSVRVAVYNVIAGKLIQDQIQIIECGSELARQVFGSGALVVGPLVIRVRIDGIGVIVNGLRVATCDDGIIALA